MTHPKPFELLIKQNGLYSETSHARQDAFLMLKLMVRGEADVNKDRLTSQSEIFSSLRASLLNKNMARTIPAR